MTDTDAQHADEILAFWEVARVRAGVVRVAAVTGPGVSGSMVPPTWAFGDDPEVADRLLDLVLAGEKTATSAALVEYELAGEPLPRRGDLAIVVDGAGRPAALIRTTQVETLPFDRVDEELAAAEGEGDRTLASWRTEHEAYWHRVLEPLGAAFAPGMPVVTERFELLYPRPGDRRASEG